VNVGRRTGEPASSRRENRVKSADNATCPARSEQRRPELAKRLRARRALVADIIAATNRATGRGQAVDPAWAGPMLLALEDGFRLHRLIDPDTTPADSFVRAVSELQRLIGLGGPSPQRSRRQGSRAVRGSGKAR